MGTTAYGERFATIVARDRVFGVQFHPEKSSAHGLRMLENFVFVCRDLGGARAARDGPARMILLPAIDILEGKAVRLSRGDFEQRTVYDADPLEAARRWVAGGARALHVVDLDGARSGLPANLEHVRADRLGGQRPRAGGGRPARRPATVRDVIRGGAPRASSWGRRRCSDVDFLDEVIAAHREPAGGIAGRSWGPSGRPRAGPSRPRSRWTR